MKNLLLLIIIAGAGYVGYQKYSETTKTGIPAYSESRLVLSFGRRDVEMVSFVKRDSSDSCDAAKSWSMNNILNCNMSETCSVKEFSCRDKIPDRYMRMFEEKSASTTFMKAAHKQTGREMILLNWGLTSHESKEICKVIKGAILNRNQKDRDLTARCI